MKKYLPPQILLLPPQKYPAGYVPGTTERRRILAYQLFCTILSKRHCTRMLVREAIIFSDFYFEAPATPVL